MSDTHQHPLKMARLRRNLTQQGLAVRTQLGVATIKRAETGEPISADSRAQLCLYFGKTSQELGLMSEKQEEQAEVSHDLVSEADPLPVKAASMMQRKAPLFLMHNQAVDRLHAVASTPEQRSGEWLVLEASGVAQLLEEGWSLETVLESLQVILKGVQLVQKLSRRKILQLGAAAIVGDVVVPEGSHPSAEERAQLHIALSENIGAGWKLFHTTSTSQVLAVGYAQLYLIQHVSVDLYPSLRPIYYSSIYNLIGAALDFQGRYGEAYQNHERAYVAALEGMDVLSMAQSRTCQANGLRGQHRFREALEVIEAALRLLSTQNTAESTRLKSHLLACAAENAALLGEANLTQEHLHASEGLLAQLPFTREEEFDHASWHQYAGTCALILQQQDTAIKELERAVEQLPPQWLVRHATALMPLAIAYARNRDREQCVETVKKADQMIQAINAASLKRQFVGYLEQEIQGWFPNDEEIGSLISNARQQMLLTGASA